MGWQCHQLDHMQIIFTSLQTDNHTNTSSLNFLQAGCSSRQPTNSVKALKSMKCIYYWYVICCFVISNSASRSRSRSSAKKLRSRSRSPVRRESARRKSRSRSPVKQRSRSPREHPASKRGPQTPPDGSHSPSPVRGGARRGSRSHSPLKSRSKSPSEHRVSDRGPRTPQNGSPQENSEAQTSAEHRSTSPAAGDNPRHSRQSRSPPKNRSRSPSPQQGGRRGPHTPPSPSTTKWSSICHGCRGCAKRKVTEPRNASFLVTQPKIYQTLQDVSKISHFTHICVIVAQQCLHAWHWSVVIGHFLCGYSSWVLTRVFSIF